MYSNDQAQNPVSASESKPEMKAAIIIFAALGFLIAVHLGFRGVSVSGVTGGLVK